MLESSARMMLRMLRCLVEGEGGREGGVLLLVVVVAEEEEEEARRPSAWLGREGGREGGRTLEL